MAKLGQEVKELVARRATGIFVVAEDDTTWEFSFANGELLAPISAESPEPAVDDALQRVQAACSLATPQTEFEEKADARDGEPRRDLLLHFVSSNWDLLSGRLPQYLST